MLLKKFDTQGRFLVLCGVTPRFTAKVRRKENRRNRKAAKIAVQKEE